MVADQPTLLNKLVPKLDAELQPVTQQPMNVTFTATPIAHLVKLLMENVLAPFDVVPMEPTLLPKLKDQKVSVVEPVKSPQALVVFLVIAPLVHGVISMVPAAVIVVQQLKS